MSDERWEAYSNLTSEGNLSPALRGGMVAVDAGCGLELLLLLFAYGICC